MFNLCIYIFCLIFLIFSSIVKSKYLKRLSIIMSLLLIIFLFCNSTKAIDSINYEFTFNNSMYITDRLFFLFTSFIKNSFDDYRVYRGIIGIISMLPIIYISLKEGNSKCLCFVLAMFMLFPMFQNIVALRNSLAAVIIIFAFYYLLKNDATLGNFIVITSFIIIAAQIHSNMYLYLPILLVYYLIMKTKIKYIYIMIFSFIISLVIRTNFILNIINLLIPVTKQTYIISMNDIGYGFILTIIWQLAYFIILKSSMKKLNVSHCANKFDNNIYNFNKALLCIIPLYMINVLFFRIVRNVLIFTYILVYKSNVACSLNKRKEMSLLFILNILLLFVEASGYASLISILF